jgi:DNA-binding transcriptional LysR family regulator
LSIHDKVLHSWDDARFFLAVAECGSANAAGRELGLAHTTIGRRVRALEERFAVTLFRRTRGSDMELTEDGRTVLAEARRMGDAASAFAASLSGAVGRPEGEVRVAAAEGLANFWLIPRMQGFVRDNPKIRLNWFVTNRVAGLLGKDFDIGISWSRPTDETVGTCRKLAECGFSVFAPSGYKLPLPRTREELLNHPLLQFNGYYDNPGLGAWNEVTDRAPSTMRLENSSASQAAMSGGELLTLLPDYASIVEPSFERAPVDLGIVLEVWLVFATELRKSARVRTVCDEISRLVAADKGTWFR